MRKWGLTLLTLSLSLFLATGCSLPRSAPPLPTPTLQILPILPTAMPASPTAGIVLSVLPATTIPGTSLLTLAPSANFCSDGQVTALINSLKIALQTSDGALLASLVSPAHGMDVRLYRNGRVVNYDQGHAKFLFDSSFVADWGVAPASGRDIKGTFHELIVPALLDVFNLNYTLACNQVQVGGTSYDAKWPYHGINFYSVYYPGSQGSGSLDWHTWLLGMHHVNGRPYLYAIMQFMWEP